MQLTGVAPARRAPEPAEAVLDSERRWFGAGADRVTVGGADLYLCPGAAPLTAAAVGVLPLVDSTVAGRTVRRWSDVFARNGFAVVRLYARADQTRLTDALVDRGFRAASERGYVFTARPKRRGPVVDVRPVESDDDWRRKVEFHARCDVTPYGYPWDPVAWTRFERSKAASSRHRAFLVRHREETVAAFGLLDTGDLLRLKNVVVRPDHRHLGIATAVVAHVTELARRRRQPVGLVAAVGTPGDHLYRALGGSAVVDLVELTRDVA